MWAKCTEFLNVKTVVHILSVPRNFSRGRGVIPSLAKWGGAVLVAYNSVGTTSLECSVLECGQVYSMLCCLLVGTCHSDCITTVFKKKRGTTTTQCYKNARKSRIRPLAFTAVGTLIHKGHCSPHLVAAGHTTTGSHVDFKFPELLGSPT
jgi:hypothetical protein